MESLGRVAHPTAEGMGSNNKILELQARSVTSQHLSVPLKVVQTIIGVLPPKVLAVLTKDPLKFFGLAALCKQNFDLLGGSGEFLSKVIRELEGGTAPKAPKISLIETWHTPDDLLEPLRLLIGVVLLSNVTYGLCLLGLLGVACRLFTDLRQQELVKGGVLMPKHVRQVMRYVETIRRAYSYSCLTVDQVVYYHVFQAHIFTEAVALEVKTEAEELATTGLAAARNALSVQQSEADKEKARREKEKARRAGEVSGRSCDRFQEQKGCPIKSCHYTHKCEVCFKTDHGRFSCPKAKKKI